MAAVVVVVGDVLQRARFKSCVFHICHTEVTTKSRAHRPRFRKADRSRASGPPLPGECRDSTNSPADGELWRQDVQWQP